MQITKLGHSCLHVVDGDANILLDPGTFSAGFEQLTDLTAILITHGHMDHLDPERLQAVVAANPKAAVYADSASAATLKGLGINVTAVAGGDNFDVGTPVSVHGAQHAVIHRDIPVIPNASFLIGGRLFHPGDSFTVPDVPVEILALPSAAPWMAIKESVDYLREVTPRTAIPIHEKILANPAMSFGLLKGLKPAGSEWIEPADGEEVEL